MSQKKQEKWRDNSGDWWGEWKSNVINSDEEYYDD